MDVAVLFSGAKDSTFAIYKAEQRGHNVKCLITLIPDNQDSPLFGQPNLNYVKLQSDALELPIIVKQTKGIEGEEEKDLYEVLKSIKGIQGVVTGCLDNSIFVPRINKVCHRLGLEHITPSWQDKMPEYWEEIIVSGFDVIITSISSEGLDESWLGRKMDMDTFRELSKLSKRYCIHRGFEKGEAETFTLDGPIFRKRVKILKARKEWDGVRGIYAIDEATVEDK